MEGSNRGSTNNLLQHHSRNAPPERPYRQTLGSIMDSIQTGLQNLAQDDNEAISDLVMSLVDYYQFHIKKLKSIIFEKQQELIISRENADSLKSLVIKLREQISTNQARSEHRSSQEIEDLRRNLFEKERELSNSRIDVETFKERLFHAKQELVRSQAEISRITSNNEGNLRMNQIKDQELEHLKRRNTVLEEDCLELRQKNSELYKRIDQIQQTPYRIDREEIHQSSKFLIEEITSLKRELIKAKQVVKNINSDSEALHTQSYRKQRDRSRSNKERLNISLDEGNYQSKTSRFDYSSQSKKLHSSMLIKPPGDKSRSRERKSIKRNPNEMSPLNPLSTGKHEENFQSPEVDLYRRARRSLGASPNDTVYSKSSNTLKLKLGYLWDPLLQSDPNGFLTGLQRQEEVLRSQLLQIPTRIKTQKERETKIQLENDIEHHQKAIHLIKNIVL